MAASAAAAASIVMVVAGAAPTAAHDDIAGSEPPSGTTLDDPISEVTIDFGEEVSDVEIAVIGPDDLLVEPATVELLSPTEARVEFPLLEQEGVYFVRYLAPVVLDGHTLAGAITFTYGDAGGSTDLAAILLVAGVALVVLGIGGALSWRRYRSANRSEVDEDLSDVGV